MLLAVGSRLLQLWKQRSAFVLPTRGWRIGIEPVPLPRRMLRRIRAPSCRSCDDSSSRNRRFELRGGCEHGVRCPGCGGRPAINHSFSEPNQRIPTLHLALPIPAIVSPSDDDLRRHCTARHLSSADAANPLCFRRRFPNR